MSGSPGGRSPIQRAESARGRARGVEEAGRMDVDPSDAGVAGGSGGNPRGASARRPPPTKEEVEARGRALTRDYVLSKPPRDGFVKQGTMQHQRLPQPSIVANYFNFDTHPQFQMRLYSVQVTPETDDLRLVRRLVFKNAQQIGGYIINGLNLYATRPVRPEALSFPAVYTVRDQPDVNYMVNLTYVRNVDSSEPEVFQFYNVVVRTVLRKMDFVMLGRHYFNADRAQRSLYPNWRLELWPGFENSVRQQDGGLMLNVESVWKVIQDVNVLQILTQIRNEAGPDFRRACDEKIVGMMVITKYKPKGYKISRIDYDSNPNSTFEGRNGVITYMDYYRQKYPDARITVDRQPMLVCDPRERDIRRGQIHPIYLVPELCYPCGLTEELRSNFRLMKDCARDLHMDPNRRVQVMRDFVHRANNSPDIRQFLMEWGVRIKPDPVTFPGRFLNTEDICMFNNDKATPDDKADWTMAFRSKRMLSSMPLKNWIVVATNRDQPNIQNLVGTMQRVGGPLGYQIERPQICSSPHQNAIVSTIQGAIDKNRNLELIFVVLPTNKLEGYAEVKKLCSVQQGIPSQCFLSKNLGNKGLMSICTKMIIQMNAKQGGIPWGVSNPLKDIMIMGYDVHHAGPAGGRSIGAMCATVDATLGRYFSCVKMIPNAGIEVATCVADMFRNCLKAYKEKNGVYPSKLIMYRDGVGEGQLRDVFDHEIAAFKVALEDLYKNAGQDKGKLCYIVVNKRINTRLMERTPKGFQNPRPGLVVDHMVTRPERYDFFLISQTARQGCVSPTYYNVLHDELMLPPDRLQIYTWKLTHLYYNWSGTVAVPAPCQNAHKLALQVGTALGRPGHDRLRYSLHFL